MFRRTFLIDGYVMIVVGLLLSDRFSSGEPPEFNDAPFI